MYEKIKAIKDEVELFPNAKFYSIADDSVIIENKTTGALYKVPYEETDNGIVFDGEEAELVKEKNPTPKDEFIENSKNLKNTISRVFNEDEYEDAISNLKKMIAALPSVEQNILLEEEILEETEYEGILEEKIREYDAIEKEFINSLKFFDEEGEIIPGKHSISNYKVLYEDTKEEWENYIESIRKYHEFKELIVETYDEEICEVLLKNINVEDNIEIAAPKALVIAKNTINEDINAIEETKNIIDYWNVIYNEDGINPDMAVGKIFNFAKRDNEKPKFLKFKMGVFTVEDAMTLSSEIDHALSHIGYINDEELDFIANQKEILEYMIRTRKISDRMMNKLIRDFNEKFTDKEREDEYIQSQLGFKDREERKLGNIQGKADVEPDAEIKE